MPIANKTSWRTINSLYDIRKLLNKNIPLNLRDARYITRSLNQKKQTLAAIRMAKNFIKCKKDRYSVNILLNSTLNWLISCNNEQLVKYYLDELLQNNECLDTCSTFIPAVINHCDSKKKISDLHIITIGVLGETSLQIQKSAKMQQLPASCVQSLSKQVNTYLLSVGNYENFRIRLYLLRYFAQDLYYFRCSSNFDHALQHFGRSILEQLMMLLNARKTESVAASYIKEVLPLMFVASNSTQQLINNKLTSFMLRSPQRFPLLIKTLGQEIHQNNWCNQGKTTYLKHVANMIQVATTLNNKHLTYDLLESMLIFQKEQDYLIIVKHLLSKLQPNTSFHDSIKEIAFNVNKDSLSTHRRYLKKRRGRRPSYTNNKLDIVSTIDYLSR